MTALYFYPCTLNWQGHIRSGQGCLSVLLCCFSLRVRPAHVVQAPCGAPKRPPSDSLTSSRFDSGIFKEAEWGVLNAHLLTMTQKMPKSDRWRRVSPWQFRIYILLFKYVFPSASAPSNLIICMITFAFPAISQNKKAPHAYLPKGAGAAIE